MQAEQQARQTCPSASRQRQSVLDAVRTQHRRVHQNAETMLKRIRALAQQDDHVLAVLGLAALPSSVHAPPVPTPRPDELATLRTNQQHEAQSALTNRTHPSRHYE
ncbi:hypothetical protein [Candidatus Chloroploca asiatica]|uniref:Uncharacterized protein n=1 Tax=Candidatus Chloroploca asiatica TaxID=1506545 RepID=A0A2H3L6L6_9CHLR|nr:hypothetical protein [Candidatus Chloroploca asiatica]PDW00654.1 hypothetical protein A9Q02_21595 [Candidatus Chloroploca asiatica]